MQSEGVELTIPTSERPQTHALDRAATRIDGRGRMYDVRYNSGARQDRVMKDVEIAVSRTWDGDFVYYKEQELQMTRELKFLNECL